MPDKEIKWRSKVFGSLRPSFITIHIAFGYGQNDGGGLREVKTELVPIQSRMPNSLVWVTLLKSEIIKIEPIPEHT